jgi:hypothetical protein
LRAPGNEKFEDGRWKIPTTESTNSIIMQQMEAKNECALYVYAIRQGGGPLGALPIMFYIV